MKEEDSGGFNLVHFVDQTGHTADGRQWRATWTTYPGFTMDAPGHDGEQPRWIVTVDGTVIGALPLGIQSRFPWKELREAVRDLLEEKGITPA